MKYESKLYESIIKKILKHRGTDPRSVALRDYERRMKNLYSRGKSSVNVVSSRISSQNTIGRAAHRNLYKTLDASYKAIKRLRKRDQSNVIGN